MLGLWPEGARGDALRASRRASHMRRAEQTLVGAVHAVVHEDAREPAPLSTATRGRAYS
jgi:hypothetical protein